MRCLGSAWVARGACCSSGCCNAPGVSLQRTRLLATISAIWIVFWFSDPTLGLWGGWPDRLLQLLVALVSMRWLLWGWSREESS